MIIIEWLWIVWFMLAIVCLVIEIFNSSFLFLSLGIGSIITGIGSLVSPGIMFQLLTLAIFTLLSYLWLRRMNKKMFSYSAVSDGSALYSLGKDSEAYFKNKKGLVTKTISTKSKGYVKIDREEWPAVLLSAEDETKLKEQSVDVGKRVQVVSVEGNKLVVKA